MYYCRLHSGELDQKMSAETVVVALRCRPLNKKEIAQKEAVIVNISDMTVIEVQAPNPPPKQFTFDHVFDDQSRQVNRESIN